MKQDWQADELAQHWTLSADERELLGNKAGATRLSFAILLKSFQLGGRFPDAREEVAAGVVSHLAIQTGVAPGAFLNDGDWSERTQRYQRAQIREHCGFRGFPRRGRTRVCRVVERTRCLSESGHGRVPDDGVRAFARAAH